MRGNTSINNPFIGDDEITLGDEDGTCSRTGQDTLCENIPCSSFGQSACNTQSSCCSWTPASTPPEPEITCWLPTNGQGCTSTTMVTSSCPSGTYSSQSDCASALNCGTDKYKNGTGCYSCNSGTHLTSTGCVGTNATCCEADVNNEPPCDAGYYLHSDGYCHAGPTGYSCPGGEATILSCTKTVPAGQKLADLHLNYEKVK